MSLRPLSALAALLLLGCPPGHDDKPEDDTASPTGCVDADGDGFCEGDDCDDGDDGVHPDVDEAAMEPDHVDNDCDGIVDECSDEDDGPTWWTEEVCDGVDNDCDGEVDEGLAGTYYPDVDGDGYGDALDPMEACEPGSGVVLDGSDCDDTDPAVHPGAAEVCNGVDDDCDAGTSEDGLVTLDGAENFETIQAALDEAEDGAAVAVCAGSWSENLSIEASLSLVGVAGSGATELIGDGTGSVVIVEADVVSIEGFTITGGVGSVLSKEDKTTGGGGVQGNSAKDLTLEDCVISGNEADVGGGVLAPTEGVLTMRSCVLSENHVTTTGGGLWMTDGSLEEVEFLDNSSDASAGGLYGYQGTVTLTDCSFTGNSAAYGGGLRIYLGVLEASGTSVVDNFASSYGGGVYLRNEATASGLELSENTAYYGGGVYCRDDCALSDSTVTNNESVYGAGFYTSGDATVLSTALSSNVASSHGGGLLCHEGELLLQEVVLDANTATEGGGGMLLDDCDLQLETVTVSGSESEYGGGFYLVDTEVEAEDDVTVSGNVATASGGAVYVQSNSAWDGGVLDGNEASYGAAFYLADTAVLDDAEITNNVASERAGAVYVRADADLDGLTIDGNSSLYGGGLYLNSSGETWLDDSSVTGNTAKKRGGGIRVSAGILYVTDTDLGGDKTDNSPDDIYAGGTAYTDYGAKTEVTCTGSDGCE